MELIEYTRTPITREELQQLIDLLGIRPYELIRTKETIFQKKFSKCDKNKFDWVGAMIQFPELMERPIIIKNKKAVIGRPPILVLDVL